LRRLIPASRTAANPATPSGARTNRRTRTPRNVSQLKSGHPIGQLPDASPIPATEPKPRAAIDHARASARRIDLVISDPRCSRAPPDPFGSAFSRCRNIGCSVLPISEPAFAGFELRLCRAARRQLNEATDPRTLAG